MPTDNFDFTEPEFRETIEEMEDRLIFYAETLDPRNFRDELKRLVEPENNFGLNE